jgi:hypothetical protein
MYWHNDRREAIRGTILVASSHALFADLVGEMVTWCGFTPTYPLSREAPWLALTGTTPCIVICDCAAPAEGIQRLIIEASARHIPLVLSDARMRRRVEDGSLNLPQQVAWLAFPTSRVAFAAMLDALLPSPAEVGHHITASRAGGRIPAAVRTRPVSPAVAASVPAPTESIVDPPRGDRSAIDDAPELADIHDLRSAIGAALAAKPIYDQSLRRFVWAYVTAERDAGTSPARIILSLTELVHRARITPTAVSQALTRRVILWCVEAYFGQLGGADVSLHDPDTSPSVPVLGSRE